MCGRFELENPEDIYVRFRTKNKLPDMRENNNVSPSQFVPIIFGDREVAFMKWGFIPFWAKDPKIGYKMINARSEGIEVKPSFARSFRSQRCIVPATGFYEWKQTEKEKVPYIFELKNKEMFGLAGLYDIWKNKEGEEIKTFTIITTMPNKLVCEVHDRMPVILSSKEDEGTWLDPDVNQDEDLLPLLRPFPAKSMATHEVSRGINKPR